MEAYCQVSHHNLSLAEDISALSCLLFPQQCMRLGILAMAFVDPAILELGDARLPCVAQSPPVAPSNAPADGGSLAAVASPARANAPGPEQLQSQEQFLAQQQLQPQEQLPAQEELLALQDRQDHHCPVQEVPVQVGDPSFIHGEHLTSPDEDDLTAHVDDNNPAPVDDHQALMDDFNKLQAQHLLPTNDHTTWNLVTGIGHYHSLRAGYFSINDDKAEGIKGKKAALTEAQRQSFKMQLCQAMANMTGIVEKGETRDVRKVKALKNLEIELAAYKMIVSTQWSYGGNLND